MPHFTIEHKETLCVPVTFENLKLGDSIIYTTPSALHKAMLFGRLDKFHDNIFWSYAIYTALMRKKQRSFLISETRLDPKGAALCRGNEKPLLYKVLSMDGVEGF